MTIGPVAPAPEAGEVPPHLGLLLIAYNQQATIADAVRGALAQTYSPLTVVLSDDASGDATFAEMQRAAAAYAGPHRLVLNRNPRNLGIGAHLSRAVELAAGCELLLVAAGDDVSMPQRCARTAAAWLASGRRLDLIASALEDLDADGQGHGTLMPDDLGRYRSLADWVARPPHVIGAAQAWTRRLWERFGPLPAGVVAEDRVMVFRALGSGGAATLPEPLVRYRRGGISRRRRARDAADVIARLTNNSRHAVIELEQMLADAAAMGQLDTVREPLGRELARERCVLAVFDADGLGAIGAALRAARGVSIGFRLRLLVYAAWPGLLAPWFWLKRRRA